MSSTPMPAAFVGHGSPMNALDDNRYTRAWRAFGPAVPRPRAVLVVSAHWFIGATAVTAIKKPRTIHDFYGAVHPPFGRCLLARWRAAARGVHGRKLGHDKVHALAPTVGAGAARV